MYWPNGKPMRGTPTLKSTSSRPYLSERGAELFSDWPGDRPMLTVENYLKWYNLYVIHPDGRVTIFDLTEKKCWQAECDFISLFEESAYGDHTYNPKFVMYLAELHGMDVSNDALEALIGRWALEHDGFEDDVRRHLRHTEKGS